LNNSLLGFVKIQLDRPGGRYVILVKILMFKANGVKYSVEFNELFGVAIAHTWVIVQ